MQEFQLDKVVLSKAKKSQFMLCNTIKESKKQCSLLMSFFFNFYHSRTSKKLPLSCDLNFSLHHAGSCGLIAKNYQCTKHYDLPLRALCTSRKRELNMEKF